MYHPCLEICHQLTSRLVIIEVWVHYCYLHFKVPILLTSFNYLLINLLPYCLNLIDLLTSFDFIWLSIFRLTAQGLKMDRKSCNYRKNSNSLWKTIYIILLLKMLSIAKISRTKMSENFVRYYVLWLWSHITGYIFYR